jgi:hypothetical protein
MFKKKGCTGERKASILLVRKKIFKTGKRKNDAENYI